MDRRQEELKILKIAYRKERRRAIGFWVFLTWLSGILCLLLAVPCLQQLQPGVGFVSLLESWLDKIPILTEAFGILSAQFGRNLPYCLGMLVLVFGLSILMWAAGSRKLHRNEAYLSYRTLSSALQQEKKYQH